jgi:hypothetical protein
MIAAHQATATAAFAWRAPPCGRLDEGSSSARITTFGNAARPVELSELVARGCHDKMRRDCKRLLRPRRFIDACTKARRYRRPDAQPNAQIMSGQISEDLCDHPRIALDLSILQNLSASVHRADAGHTNRHVKTTRKSPRSGDVRKFAPITRPAPSAAATGPPNIRSFSCPPQPRPR